ncbi:MAG: tetratricopeptide repeat protein [Myxococcales bacterium]|nr:tetratricopeptide repeat protein [Myxococcales bacterium]MCB9609658.1 tetratricopeptide repeat protein [Polyangiaceae bacterium]
MSTRITQALPKFLVTSVGILAFWVWGLGAPCARATPGATESSLKAAQLFDSARDLMRQGDFATACKLLKESQALEPSDGTRLNLGVCNERQGKLATALEHYQAVLLSAENQGHAERARFARERLEALRPKVSYIEVRSAGATPQSLELDTRPLGVARIGQRISVDPGEHRLYAEFPDGTIWTKRVTIEGEASLVVVRLPGKPKPKEPTASSTPENAGADTSQDAGASEPDTFVRDAGLATLAVGGFSVLLSGFLALHALDLRGESDAECPNDRCSERGVELNDDARRNGNWATFFGVLGVAAIGSGVLMVTLFAEPDSPQVGAGWSQGAWTLSARGSF